MSCQRCQGPRIVSVGGKVSDRFWASMEVADGSRREHEGYVPHDMGLGRGGDYFDIAFCLTCGQIQDEPSLDVVFPIPPCKLETDE